MKFGLVVPNSGPFATPQRMRQFAEIAEGLGYDSIWTHDHVHRTADDVEFNPAMGGWEAWNAKRPIVPDMYDALASLAYLAAATSHIRLGTSAVVLPLHNPVWLAKTAATIDQLSDGRFELGVGIGGQNIGRELRTIGKPHLEKKRGMVADEWLAVIRGVWSEPCFSFHGELIDIENAVVYPKPRQQFPPLLIAGFSEYALRRAVRHANGWLPIHLSPAKLAEGRERLSALAEDHGREPSEIEVYSEHWLGVDAEHETAVRSFTPTVSKFREYITNLSGATARDRKRLLDNQATNALIGGPDAVGRRIAEYEASGVDHMIFQAIAQDFDQLVEMLQLFKEEVIDELG